MKLRLWLSGFLLLCESCSGTVRPVQLPQVTTPPVVSSPAAFSPPLPESKDLPPFLPQCDGMQPLTQPIKFNWPNIEKRMQDLKESVWGYYSCEQPQTQVAAFYRAYMPELPYNMQETNWIEKDEGTVGIYYSSANMWIYVWIVPQPEDPYKTFVIVAQSINLISC